MTWNKLYKYKEANFTWVDYKLNCFKMNRKTKEVKILKNKISSLIFALANILKLHKFSAKLKKFNKLFPRKLRLWRLNLLKLSEIKKIQLFSNAKLKDWRKLKWLRTWMRFWRRRFENIKKLLLVHLVKSRGRMLYSQNVSMFSVMIVSG